MKTWVEGGSNFNREALYRERHEGLSEAGHFRGLVGEGAMGAVIRVEGLKGAETLAGTAPDICVLKMLSIERLVVPDSADAFLRELKCHQRLSLRLQVPNLVRCLKVVESSDPAKIYGAFPYFKSGCLRQQLRRGLSLAQALEILADAVDGLQSLHGHGFIHRDFHPANILVDSEGQRLRGSLGDLGVGMWLYPNTYFSEDDINACRARFAGHPGYIDRRHKGTPSVDLFAVGACLWEILTGSSPIENQEDFRLPKDSRARLGHQAFDCSQELLHRLTSPKSQQRYPSASQARAAIGGLIRAVAHAPESSAVDLTGKLTAKKLLTAEPTTGNRRSVTNLRRKRFAGLGWLAVGGAAFACGLLAFQPLLQPMPGLPSDRPAIESSAQPSLEVTTRSIVPIGDTQDSQAPEAAGGVAPKSELPRLASPARTARQTTSDPERVDPDLKVPVRELERIDRRIRDGATVWAELYLRELVQRYPGDAEPVRRLVLLIHDGSPKRVAEVGDLLSAALDRNPRRGDLRLLLARVELQRGRSTLAGELLRETPALSSHRNEIQRFYQMMDQDHGQG